MVYIVYYSETRVGVHTSKLSIQRVLWVKWPGREVDHTPPTSAGIKN